MASSDISSMTVTMASSKTAADAAATVSASMGKMEGMDMGGDDCKISVSRAFSCKPRGVLHLPVVS